MNELIHRTPFLTVADAGVFDDFARADTAAGVLGVSASGHTWDLRAGGMALNPGVTRLLNGQWISAAADSVIYACYRQTLPIASIGGLVRFAANGESHSDTDNVTFCFAVGKTYPAYPHMLHCTFTRAAWVVQDWNNGVARNIATGAFSPALLEDGTAYRFGVSWFGPHARIVAADQVVEVTDVAFLELGGGNAFFEHYYPSVNCHNLLVIEEVWAAAAAAGALMQPRIVGPQLVTNPDFTTNLMGWTVHASATGSASAASGQFGNCAALVNSGAASALVYQAVTTVVGERYELTYWHKNGSTTGSLHVGTGAGGDQLLAAITRNDSTWTRYRREFVATSTTSYVNLRVDGATAAATTNFDQVGVRRVVARGNAVADTLRFREMTAPGLALADGAALFLQDNGSGKSQLMVQFPSGAAQQVAIEP